MTKAMNIDEACAALSQGKTVNSANACATIVPKTVEGERRVTITHIRADDTEDVMEMRLSRMRQTYMKHDFGLGKYAIKPAQNKAATVAETK